MDGRISACNQHARASCILQEPLISSKSNKPVRYQIVKVGASQRTGQTCSCRVPAFLGLIFLCGIRCRNSLYLVFVATCIPQGQLHKFTPSKNILFSGDRGIMKIWVGSCSLSVLDMGWKAVNVVCWEIEINCLSSDHQLFDMGLPISQHIPSSLLTLYVSKWSCLQGVSVLEKLSQDRFPFLHLMSGWASLY